jgi:hypothetical protein
MLILTGLIGAMFSIYKHQYTPTDILVLSGLLTIYEFQISYTPSLISPEEIKQRSETRETANVAINHRLHQPMAKL